jgi:CheY-like chemotaxis protein
MRTPSQLTKRFRRAAVPFLPSSWLPDVPTEKRILLAEQDQSARAFCTVVLQGLGYEVLQAADGAEALAIARREGEDGIDLLFTDLMMPALGGKELAERLWRKVPLERVVFVSEMPAATARRYWRLDDRITILKKPFSAQLLASTVRRLLEGDAPE